ncbi:hypothetical protein F5Y03DRAFT_49491 [Xylaria venustula]|nr:hypothetical protein F5Y03DRAFT_49491 [Xylaria venustula]
MERERYADRYPVVGSLRAIAPEMSYPEALHSGSERSRSHRTRSRHISSRRDAGLSREERIDYSSSGRSMPRSRVAQSSNDSHPGSNHHSRHVRSTRGPKGREYNEYMPRQLSTYGAHTRNDRTIIDHYRDDLLRHERETQRLAPAQSPPYSGWDCAYQQGRLQSDLLSVVNPMDSTYTRVLTGHNQETWYAEEGKCQSGDNGRGYEHGTVTGENDSQGEERRKQRENDYPDTGSQDWPSDEESQYGGETEYDSDDSEYSIILDGDFEEDPDQYASDGGFDEEGEPDDGFDDDNDDDDY